MDMKMVDYSERSFAVIGNTKEYKEKLQELGGKYNANLKCGAGWIFSNTKKEKVKAFIGSNEVTDCELTRKDESMRGRSVVYASHNPQTVSSYEATKNKLLEFRSLIESLDLKGRLDLLGQVTNMCNSLPHPDKNADTEVDFDSDDEFYTSKNRKRLL